MSERFRDEKARFRLRRIADRDSDSVKLDPAVYTKRTGGRLSKLTEGETLALKQEVERQRELHQISGRRGGRPRIDDRGDDLVKVNKRKRDREAATRYKDKKKAAKATAMEDAMLRVTDAPSTSSRLIPTGDSAVKTV